MHYILSKYIFYKRGGIKRRVIEETFGSLIKLIFYKNIRVNIIDKEE
jgi:hypothetical protein